MRTEICLTVDTEFSTNGVFADPVNRAPIGAPNVYCPVGDQQHGLPFLLRTLGRYGLPATFFVETLNTAYFGDEPMRRPPLRARAAVAPPESWGQRTRS